MNISIRQLSEEDWRQWAEMRLRGLKSDPLVFNSKYEKELPMTEDYWRARLRTPETAIFLLYHYDSPIGVTCVSVNHNDPSRKTAVLWGSWLAPDFRSRGLSKLMYQTRIDWAKCRPTVEKLLVAHRASNVASKRANQKHGFVLTHTTENLWPDGVTEDLISYELNIKKETDQNIN